MARYPATVTAAEAEAFFRDRVNFETLSVGQIYRILGFPNEWADWDLGRVCCAWSGSGRTVRVYTEGNGRVDYVELIRRKTFFLFGGSAEVLWADEKYTGKRN